MPHASEWRCRHMDGERVCRFPLGVLDGRNLHLADEAHVQYLEIITLPSEQAAALAHIQCPQCGTIRQFKLLLPTRRLLSA